MPDRTLGGVPLTPTEYHRLVKTAGQGAKQILGRSIRCSVPGEILWLSKSEKPPGIPENCLGQQNKYLLGKNPTLSRNFLDVGEEMRRIGKIALKALIEPHHFSAKRQLLIAMVL
jgi:hypothetical protein